MTWTRQNNNWKKAYNKLAEDYFDLQHKYDELLRDFGSLQEDMFKCDEVVDEQTKSCCGQTTFVADKQGVIDRPSYSKPFSEGRYTVLIKREKDDA